eukprot:scaffold392_cov177-Amphora_coffeaeformis.AAC.12
MKSHVLLAFLAILSSTLAFSNLPLTIHTLIFPANDARRRQNPAELQPAGRGLQPLQSSTVPSFSNETSTSSLVSDSGVLSAERKDQLTLLFRSSFCALSSVATWAMVKHAGMTIVQASALQGLLSCLALPKPYAMAWFCGTFAGMSAHPTAFDEAFLLALACTGVFYQFEANKLALGRGGRLGLIAFLSNLVYYVLRMGPQQSAGLVVRLIDQVRPGTAVGVAAAGAVLAGIRIRSAKLGIDSPSMSQRTVKLSTQFILLMFLLNRLSGLGVSTSSLMTTFATTFASSVLAWRSKYTIFPVALLGVLSCFLMPNLAPAVYLGGFIGMTGLANFRTFNFLRAAVLSAVLLKCGVLAGFGGRLGFLAYLGVNFAM